MKNCLRILSACVLLSLTATVQAHGKLVVSSPVNGATIDHAPAELRLQFNEPVEAAFTRVGLTGPDDRAVVIGPTTVDKADSKAVVVSVPALSSGAYRAHWTMVGPDGHKVAGTVAFKVR